MTETVSAAGRDWEWLARIFTRGPRDPDPLVFGTWGPSGQAPVFTGPERQRACLDCGVRWRGMPDEPCWACGAGARKAAAA